MARSATGSVGFLADTHCRKADGSDLPDAVLDAFKGVAMIVHLGYVGRHVILDRLAAVAPVMSPSPEGSKFGYVPLADPEAAPTKVIEVGGLRVGITFNLAQPDKLIVLTDGVPTFADRPLSALLQRRFKQDVDVVAFGGTHVQHQEEREGVLFFNPGSPTLPSDHRGGDDIGGVAVLRVAGGKASVDLVRLRSATS